MIVCLLALLVFASPAVRVEASELESADEDAFKRVYGHLLERLRGTPGVQSAGMIQTLPILADYMLSFSIQGRPPAAPGQELSANFRVASPGYFESLAIPVRRGRTFTAHDTATSPMVAVIDEAALRRPMAGPEVMRAQFEYLLRIGQLPNIDVQVLPFSAGPHAALTPSE